MKHAWAFVAVIAAAGCALEDPQPFGIACTSDVACSGALHCDVERGMCLPKALPDPRGRSCAEPLPVALSQAQELLGARTSLVVQEGNSAALMSWCAGAGDEQAPDETRVVVFAVTVPEFQDGQPGFIVRAQGADVVGVVLDPCDDDLVDLQGAAPLCADGGAAQGHAALARRALAAGEHRIAVAVRQLRGASTSVELTVEQARCPIAFDPALDGTCFGFVALHGPPPRTEHTATTLDDGRVFVAGGVGANDRRRDDAWIFDGASDSFDPAGLFDPRAGHAAALLVGGAVLLYGGNTSANSPSAEAYDPGAGIAQQNAVLLDPLASSSARGSLIAPLSGDIAALVTAPATDATVLLRRAADDAPVTCDRDYECREGEYCVTRVEDAIEDGVCVCVTTACSSNTFSAWIYPDALGGAFDFYARGAVISVESTFGPPDLLFIGGRRGLAGATPFAPRLLSTLSLSTTELPPTLTGVLPDVLDARGVGVGRTAVIAGGRSSDEVPIDDVVIFSPTLETPPVVRALSTARADHAVVALPDGRVLVIGGVDADDTPLASTEIIDVARGVVMEGPPLPMPMRGSTANVLPDGRVLVLGGQTSDGLVADALLLMSIPGTLEPPRAGTPVALSDAGDTCDDAPALDTPSGALTATTAQALANFDATDVNLSALGTSGKDVFFSIDVPASSTLQLLLSPLTPTDLALVVVSGCPGVAIVAASDIAGGGLAEVLTVPAANTERRLFIVIDSFIAEPSTPFTLGWTLLPSGT